MSSEQLDRAVAESLALELERWAAYASGALDEARFLHRHVRERVRRAERSAALSASAIEHDIESLASLETRVRDIAGEVERLRALLAERTALNDSLLEGATDLTVELAAAIRANMRDQERAAAALSTTNRDDQRARARLDRALHGHRKALSRRFRRSPRTAAARELTSVETAARRSAETLAAAKARLATLRAVHERLTAESVALAEEASELRSLAPRLELAGRALDEAADAMSTAFDELTQAREAAGASRALTDEMYHHVADATERLAEATTWERDATGSYDDAQQLTTDVNVAIRQQLDDDAQLLRAGPSTSDESVQAR